MRQVIIALLLASPGLVGLSAYAADAKTPQPPATKICTPTELIVATNFDRATPPTRKGPVNGWQAGIGEWSVADGALRGSEVAEDHHPSSLTYRFTARDLVIAGEFKLGTAREIAFGCRDTVPPNNHLARTGVSGTSLWIQRMSGISKTTKSEKIKEQKVTFEPDRWYPITIEIVGDQYLVRAGDQTITARHERFRDEKGIVALIVKGQGAEFRNIALWHAKPAGAE